MLKDIAENIKFAKDAAEGARNWASRSVARVLVLSSLVGVFVVAGQALYLNYLLQQLSDATNAFNNTTNILTKKSQYEAALDAISSCLESQGADDNLSDWYCSRARSLFKKNTEQLNFPGAREIFQMNAYLAMRDLMRSRMRSLELSKVARPTDTPQGKMLSLFVSKTGTIVAATFTGVLIFSTYAYLALPLKSRGNSAKNPGVSWHRLTRVDTLPIGQRCLPATMRWPRVDVPRRLRTSTGSATLRGMRSQPSVANQAPSVRRTRPTHPQSGRLGLGFRR